MNNIWVQHCRRGNGPPLKMSLVTSLHACLRDILWFKFFLVNVYFFRIMLCLSMPKNIRGWHSGFLSTLLKVDWFLKATIKIFIKNTCFQNVCLRIPLKKNRKNIPFNISVYLVMNKALYLSRSQLMFPLSSWQQKGLFFFRGKKIDYTLGRGEKNLLSSHPPSNEGKIHARSFFPLNKIKGPAEI